VTSSAPTGFSIRSVVLPIFVPSLLFASGEASLLPILPATAEKLGADLPMAGLIAGMVMLGTLLFDIPAASVVHRLGERRAMILGSAVATAAIMLAAISNQLWMLALAMLAAGMMASIFGLARHGYMAEMVPISHRARALSMLGGTFRGGAFLGPLAGAWIAEVYGPQAVFWIGASFCALAGVFLWIATPADHGTQAAPLRIRAVFSVAKQEHKSLLTLGVAAALLNMIRTARGLGLPLWALAIGLSPSHASLYIALAGGLDFALFYTSGQVMDRFGRRAVAVPTLVGLAITFAFLPFSFDDPTFLTVALLMSLANALGSGVVMVLGADLAPPTKRNEFLASFRLLNDMGNAAAPQLISLLTVLLSLSFAFFAMSGLSVVGALLMIRYLPKTGPAVAPKSF
jgi:MFS family permease